MREPYDEAAVFADLDRTFSALQRRLVLAPEMLNRRAKTVSLTDAEFVLQLLGLVSHGKYALQRLIRKSQLPQRPSRIAQAHDARILHRARLMVDLIVLGTAGVHLAHGRLHFSLVAEDVGYRPFRLNPVDRISTVLRPGARVEGNRTRLGEVGAREVIPFEAE